MIGAISYQKQISLIINIYYINIIMTIIEILWAEIQPIWSSKQQFNLLCFYRSSTNGTDAVFC